MLSVLAGGGCGHHSGGGYGYHYGGGCGYHSDRALVAGALLASAYEQGTICFIKVVVYVMA